MLRGANSTQNQCTSKETITSTARTRHIKTPQVAPGTLRNGISPISGKRIVNLQ
jgi:hypothetical protein